MMWEFNVVLMPITLKSVEVQAEMCNTMSNDNGVCGTRNIDGSSYNYIEDDIPQNPHAVKKWKNAVKKIPHDHAMAASPNPIDTTTVIFLTYAIKRFDTIPLPPMHDVLVDNWIHMMMMWITMMMKV